MHSSQCNLLHNHHYISIYHFIDCADIVQSDSRHRISQIRQVVDARSINDCAFRCRTLFFCRSISYRYDYNEIDQFSLFSFMFCMLTNSYNRLIMHWNIGTMEACSTIACFQIQELKTLEGLPTLIRNMIGRFTELIQDA